MTNKHSKIQLDAGADLPVFAAVLRRRGPGSGPDPVCGRIPRDVGCDFEVRRAVLLAKLPELVYNR